MKYAIGCDEAAVEMKETLKQYLLDQGVEVIDYGTEANCAVLYPDIAEAVAQCVASGEADRAVLCCGTGIGMAMCANKVKGVRAAVCHDIFSAQRARMSNDAQVFCVGARIIAPTYALTLLKAFHKAEFVGGNSSAKVDKISENENKNFI